MPADRSIEFFERQFARQVNEPDPGLNPFEQAALPHLRGRVLDYGCGLGQLSLAAARAGRLVVALDASEVAIARLRTLAELERLPLRASVADLRQHRLAEDYDTIVCIGLLMFFDCPTAERALAELQQHLRPGGTMVINVLVQGTTFMDMFDPQGHCLFGRDALLHHFQGWEILSSVHEDFPAPRGLHKAFCTVTARRPTR